MATELSAKLSVAMTSVLKDMGIDLSEPRAQIDYAYEKVLAQGVSSNKADLIYGDEHTLTATSKTLVLTVAGGGDLKDDLGNALTFVKVRKFILENLESSSGFDLEVGGAVSHAWLGLVKAADDILILEPGGIIAVTAPIDGIPVGADTADQLKINSGANSVKYQVVIVGTSS